VNRRYRQVWHAEARREVVEAADWYLSRSEDAEANFISRLEEVIKRISTNPRQFPKTLYNTRSALLDRFPYAVIFREIENQIQIIAIAHGKRKPGYWLKRSF
jgi:plasmid stabilization system protein ParE